MADAAGLADHQIGRRQHGIQGAVLIVNAAIVVGKLATGLLNHRAVVGHIGVAAPNAHHFFGVQLQDRLRHRFSRSRGGLQGFKRLLAHQALGLGQGVARWPDRVLLLLLTVLIMTFVRKARAGKRR